MAPRFLTETEAAEYLASVGISSSVLTLQTLRCRGRGPRFARVGRKVRYKTSDLEAWIADRTVVVEIIDSRRSRSAA